MKRDIQKLALQHFDVIVVGAGVHGAIIARDAALRGLKTALIDKGDICGQTSHNSLKIIHGGLRYLQHLNIKRTLESIQEQKIWLAIAPHLVKPMQCIMPTYGHGMRGPEVMWLGIQIYELLGFGKNRHIPQHRKIPKGSVLSRKKCVQMIADVEIKNLTGAALWYDAQVFAADEAVIQTAASAAEHGAEVANYVSAEKILFRNKKVLGIQAKDALTGNDFEIHGKLVINASGPWAKNVLSSLNLGEFNKYFLPLTKSMNIITRPLFNNYAVAINSKRKSDSIVGATKRLYFFTPWKGCTVTGTTHFPYNGDPDSLSVSKNEVQKFITEINEVTPHANLTLDDVHYCYKGLTPSEENKADNKRSHKSKIIDHSADGIDGLISAIGIKFTTARLTAEKTIDLACKKLGREKLACSTRTRALENSEHSAVDPTTLTEDEFKTFCQHKVKTTMVIHLTDLALRRMDLAMQGSLSLQQLKICLDVLTHTYAWDTETKINEIKSLNKTWLTPELKQNLNKLITELQA